MALRFGLVLVLSLLSNLVLAQSGPQGGVVGPGGPGSSSIISGTTPCTGCASGGVLYNGTGGVTADSGFTYGGAGGLVGIANGTISGSSITPFFQVTGTWNTSGVVTGALLANVTNTASGTGSKLLNLEINSSSIFSIDKAGGVTTAIGFNVDDFGELSASRLYSLGNIGGVSNTSTILLGGALDTILSRPAAATWQFGAADAASPVAQSTKVQSVVGGTTATNGTNWTLTGSLSTGTGTSGDIIFKTGVNPGSGTAQATPTTGLTIKGETQALITGGTLTIGTVNSTTGLFVCETAGLLSSGVTTCVASDKAVKHDITPINDDILNKLLTKRGVRFTYNEGKGAPGRRIGVIANDWETEFPELVDFDSTGIRHFDYAATWGLTVELVRRLHTNINSLKNEFEVYRRTH